MLKKSAHHFLIGVLSVLPFAVVIEVTLFMKDMLESFVRHIYSFSDNAFIAGAMFVLGVFLLISIGSSISKYGRSFVVVLCDWIALKIPLLNSIYRVTKKNGWSVFRSRRSGSARGCLYRIPEGRCLGACLCYQ